MTIAAAVASIDGVEAGDEFANRIADHRDNPENGVERRARRLVRPDSAGVKAAMLVRCGPEPSTDQLDALSGGMDAVGVFVGVGATVGVIAFGAAAPAAF